MEQKMKYQYTYFIHPYVVNEKFDKYILRLLHNKNCKLKLFEKEKDANLYTYFLPEVRKYLFWSFDYSKSKIKKLNEFDNDMKSMILSKNECVMFEYNLESDIQGKIGNEEGIYFNIAKIEIICFNNGICFLNIKTTLSDNSTIQDLCNFNYKFRDINSTVKEVKEYDNIKIQSENFSDIRDISDLIKEITGDNKETEKLNIDTERFLTYSYACINHEDWNELMKKEFYKILNVKPASYIADISESEYEKMYAISNAQYVKYGTNKISTVLLTSDINIENYTKSPLRFENEYLYQYILELYKSITMKKINNDFMHNNNFEMAKLEFIEFSKKIWIEDITNANTGSSLSENWEKVLKITETYYALKDKYDTLYKNSNIEKGFKSNKVIFVGIVLLAILSIINLILMMLGK